MVVRASPERPVIMPIGRRNGQIIDAGYANTHQAVYIEFPILIAVASKPLPAIVMPFVRKPHRNAVFSKCPDFLDQAIVQLARPFAHQELLNRLGALDELGAISPAAVGGIRA